MNSDANVSGLFRSKILLVGITLLCITILNEVFAETISANSLLTSIYFLPLQFLTAIAPLISVPLIGGATVWFFVRKAGSSKDNTLRVRYILSCILVTILLVALHIIIVEMFGPEFSAGGSGNVSELGTILILLLIAISLAGPILYIKSIVGYISKSRMRNPGRKLNLENKLIVLLGFLIGLPLFAFYYVIFMPMVIMFIGLLSTGY